MTTRFWLLALVLGLLPSSMAKQANQSQSGPHQLSLDLALVTVRIEMYSGDTRSGAGTGFFCLNKTETRLYLVTNRHIARNEERSFYPDYLVLKLHTNANDLRESGDYKVDLYRDENKQEPVWNETSPAVDVVAIELPFEEMKQRYVLKAFVFDDFIKSEIVVGLGDPVVIIGYPLGFHDEMFNLPVARQGAVASVYPVPFRGNRFFLVDANLHPGTSGSPVITRPSAMTLTTKGTVFGGRQFYVVGINSGTFGDLELNAVWFADVVAELLE